MPDPAAPVPAATLQAAALPHPAEAAMPSQAAASPSLGSRRNTAEAKRPAFHIPSLDGVRALSFLLVFFHHGVLNHVVPGGLGVTTFFFLSGFLITTLLRLEAEERGRISLGQFYLRRALRILPPLYLSLIAAVLLGVLVFRVPVRLDSLAAHAAFVGNYYHLYADTRMLPGTDVLWSLAVEEHFYLLFPVFYISLRRVCPAARHQALVMGGICLAVLLWRVYLVGRLDLADVTQMQRIALGTDTRLDSLLWGCLLAVFYNPAVDRYPLSARKADGMAVAAAVVLLAATFAPGRAFRESGRYALQSLALAPLFVAAIRGHDRLPWRWLNHPWLAHLGVLSYSLYLFHELILEAVRAVLAGRLGLLPCDLIALALALVVAQAVYVAVDRPCARLRKRLSRVVPPPAVGAGAVPGPPTAAATAGG